MFLQLVTCETIGSKSLYSCQKGNLWKIPLNTLSTRLSKLNQLEHISCVRQPLVIKQFLVFPKQRSLDTWGGYRACEHESNAFHAVRLKSVTALKV